MVGMVEERIVEIGGGVEAVSRIFHRLHIDMGCSAFVTSHQQQLTICFFLVCWYLERAIV